MKITISGRQTTVPSDIVPIVEKKLAKLDKYFKDDAQATVKFKNERDKEKIEVTITAGGCMFRSEEVDETYQNALDRATETIVRQIRKNKTRLEKRMKDVSKNELFAEAVEYEEESEFDIRTKSFSVKPMTPEEAILQMNITGHDFYMFRDGDSGEVCVVYKRRGNGYGLIIPQK
ncbi:MAG: ribosome-associated translation inhibitor RaiA [Clostridia bacterium]|nr:ribosome-associated translation inhibitor RaiA [Clostridia bacterium]